MTFAHALLWMRRIVYPLTFLLFFLSVVPPLEEMVTTALGMAALLCILVSVPFVRGLSLYISLAFLLAGAGLEWMAQATWSDVLRSFGRMAGIVTFIGLIPSLAYPVQLARFEEDVAAWAAPLVRKPVQLFRTAENLTFGMGSFMNLAAVPMTWTLLERTSGSLYPDGHPRVLSEAITRGFSLAMLWSPVGAGVALMVEMAGTTWLVLFPLSLGAALLGLLLDQVLKARQLRSLSARQPAPAQKRAEIRPRRLALLIIPLVLFTALIMLLDAWTPLGMIYIVAVLVLFYAALWSLLLGHFRGYLKRVKGLFREGIIGMYPQFGILLSAGFFVASLENSGLLEGLHHFFSGLVPYVGGAGILLLAMLLAMFFTMAGVHQLVSVTLVSLSIQPAEVGIPPSVFALGMLIALSVGIMSSPFNGTTAIMSTLTRHTPLAIAKWNAAYALLYALVTGLLLAVAVFLWPFWK